MIGVTNEALIVLLRRTIYVSLVCICLNAQGQESSVDINLIRDTIGSAFERVESLKLEAEVTSPSTISILTNPVTGVTTTSESLKPTVRSFFWAFQSAGKECLISFPEYESGTEPPPGTYTVAFNGTSLRGYNDEPSLSEPQGFIHPLEELKSTLKNRAAELTEVGRAWGRSINGFSIQELINSDSAYVVGQIPFGNIQSVAVEIPYTFKSMPDSPRRIRLYLNDEMNYAIVGWDSYMDDKLQMRLTNEAFQEIIPGLWFPMKGTVEPIDRKIGGYTLQPVTFQVTSVEANTALPADLFEIGFPAGTLVMDKRMGNVTYIAEEGMEFTEKLVAGLADHSLTTDSLSAPLTDTDTNNDEPGRILAVGVDTTPVQNRLTKSAISVVAIVSIALVATVLVRKFVH